VDLEKRRRIWKAWDEIANQDYYSDEEALNIVAKRAGVTYGDAHQVLAVDPQKWNWGPA